MQIVTRLIAFGLRQVIGVTKHLFTNPSRALPRALERANDRAWQTLGVALAGNGWLDWVKGFFAGKDTQTFREQVRRFDRYMKGLVVIKSLHAIDLENSLEEVFAEAQTLRFLSRDHPSIIGVHHCSYADEAMTRPYLVMDYFRSVSLQVYVEQLGEKAVLPLEDLVPIARQIASAMKAAHARGILHRDLKPDNVLRRYRHLPRVWYLTRARRRHPLTQGEWQAVMGSNHSRFTGEDRPVENGSWDDCQEFCKKLSQRDGKRYRLPTEAEWEYACRAGTTTPFHFGETISTDQANYVGDSTYGQGEKGVDRQQTTPVGTFPPNAWGLFDMHGNVWEWCQDWYGESPKRDLKDYKCI